MDVLQIIGVVLFVALVIAAFVIEGPTRSERWSAIVTGAGAIMILTSMRGPLEGSTFRSIGGALFIVGATWHVIDSRRRRKGTGATADADAGEESA